MTAEILSHNNFKGESPMQPPEPTEKEISLQEATDSLIAMCASTVESLSILRGLATTAPDYLRSVGWQDLHGRTVGIPCTLRSIRRDLEFLEMFFKGERRS